jgi:hypothetical membrane protein
LNRPSLLLAGPLSAILFVVGVGGLGLLVPGYNHVHQTVSEIGEVGSPAQVPFTILLCGVAGCLVLFACAIYGAARAARHSAWAAYLVGCMAVSTVGVGIFAFPHPLHNVFGISELIGYQAPAALALSWKRDPRARSLVVLSWIMFALLWAAILVNLSSLFRASAVWHYIKPVNGIAQRSLFGAWFAWCAITGALLYRSQQRPSLS